MISKRNFLAASAATALGALSLLSRPALAHAGRPGIVRAA